MSLKVEKTIYDKLAATAGVTALVSTNIFFVNAAQGTAYPYITLNRVTTDPVPVAGGWNNRKTTNITLQVDILGATYSSVKNVADQVRTALYGYSDSGGDPSVGSVILVDESDDFEQPETGRARPVYRVQMDFSIWYAD
tara:strand:- start:1282 stop:1698 length:417 start_codon:yes stop_codon:yes gene_type:complete